MTIVEALRPFSRYFAEIEVGRIEGEGRTAELRRKYAALLGEQTKKALRYGANKAVETLRTAVGCRHVPRDLAALYAFADGEFNSGALLPELEFMRADFVQKAIDANRQACTMDLLPRFMLHAIPFMRNLVGSQVFMFSQDDDSEEDQNVYLLDNEDLVVLRMSMGLPLFMKRIFLMRAENDRVGGAPCTGDFRELTPCELRIVEGLEQEVYPVVKKAGITMFSLERPSEWPASWL